MVNQTGRKCSLSAYTDNIKYNYAQPKKYDTKTPLIGTVKSYHLNLKKEIMLSYYDFDFDFDGLRC
jgi:hypothetical protein